jgi:hypothetical protein
MIDFGKGKEVPVVSACFDACSVSSSIPQARAKFHTLFLALLSC